MRTVRFQITVLKEEIKDFRFQHIIEKMIKIHPQQRYPSFSSIMADISAGVLSEIDFSSEQKRCYRKFADALTSHLYNYKSKYSPKTDISQTLFDLAELIRKSSLEEYIQNNSHLIGCFINSGYSYIPRKDIEVQTIIDFYSLVTSLETTKQRILFDNIYTRLATIPVEDDGELPF